MTQQHINDSQVIRPKTTTAAPQAQQQPALTLAAIQAKPVAPPTILQMQRKLGNQAVQRYLAQRASTNGDAFAVEDQLSTQISSKVGQGGSVGSTAVAKNVSALTGVDVTDTKVHRDSALPAQVGAKAMAVGDTVFFGKGHDSAETMGHELAHIAQNKTGNAPQIQASGLQVTAANSNYEDYADSVGSAASKSNSQVDTMAAAGDFALSGTTQHKHDMQLSHLQRIENEEEDELQLQRQVEEEDELQMQRKVSDPATAHPLQRRTNGKAASNKAGEHTINGITTQQKSPVMRETITFSDDEADVILGDRNAKTWDKYIEQYNGMVNTTIRNLRDAWQDGVNTFQTQMQFPSAGEAQPKVGEAMLKAAASELAGFLIGEIGTKYPGVGKAIGAVKGIATAVYDEQQRATAAAQGMSLGNFIVHMRTGMGNSLNDLAAQSANREDALRTDFTQNHLDQDSAYDEIQWYKQAIQRLSTLRAHSESITRSLAETWIAENFKQESNWLGQIITTGAIELKYEVYEEDGMKVYSYKHCKVAMPQGDRVAKAINATYAGKSIDLKSFKCRKKIILENTDNRHKSEEGILDANNEKIAGYLGAFGWYNGMPRGLRVGKFDES